MRRDKKFQPKHLLYYVERDGSDQHGQLWCTCRECFKDDLAAAVQHLKTATKLGEEVVPEPSLAECALAQANANARSWIRQAKERCQYMLDNNSRRTYIELSFLRDNLHRADMVLQDPESDERHPSGLVPHTTPVTTFCLRCGKSHTVNETDALNERTGNA